MCDRKPEVLGVFDAERIIAKKINSGKPLFMIKWQGYCSSQNTWEPKAHLPPELIEAFENRILTQFAWTKPERELDSYLKEE